MKPTLTRCLKSLASTVHHQLPLSARESRQLLLSLNDSFRKELDRAHPSNLPDADGNFVSTSSLPKTPRLRSSRRAAADGIERILSHPLLAEQQRPRSPSERRAKESVGLVENAYSWFTSHVANGTADLNICLSFMKTIHTHTYSPRSSPAAIRNRLKELKAGSLVLSWLWSTDQAMFQFQSKINSLLVRFLVAEDRHDTIWSWIAHPKHRDSVTRSEEFHLQRNLIAEVIQSEISFSDDLQGAMACFRKGFQRLETSQLERRRTTRLLEKGSNIITEKTVANAQIVPAEEYETWLNILSSSCPGSLNEARVKLSHPQKPDANAAYEILLKQSASGPRELPDRLRKTVLRICLEAAEVLLSQDQHEKASHLLQYAKDAFPKDLQLKETPLNRKMNHGHESEIRITQGFRFA